MATQILSYRKFYQDLNKHRRARGIVWNKVAVRAGVSPGGLGVFVRQFEDPEHKTPKALSVETMVKLLDWMGKTDLAPYLVDEDDPNATV